MQKIKIDQRAANFEYFNTLQHFNHGVLINPAEVKIPWYQYYETKALA